MRLLWNAIVKNESAVIARCVDSLLPHIDGAVVVDTGSTDNTPALLRQLFEEVGKPLELQRVPFENFAQARNWALAYARSSQLPWDYLLLADADMELRVDDVNWIRQLNGGQAYDVKQVGGSLAYWNRRLLSRSAHGLYECPTHEYLDIETAGAIDGIYFIDHADGANRPDKFQRDIALLELALKTETRLGLIERYHFYLAQSYFDARQWDQAAALYRKRVAMGGWPEEQWYAQRQLALCHERLGRHDEFLCEMLRAYSLRPARAESLCDLARYFRERGENHVSLLFAEAGLQLPYPKNDRLFVDDHVYRTGLKEEFAICAYYDEHRRQRGAKIANQLALSGNAQAQYNLFWYLQPLHEHIPSFRPRNPIAFTPPDGFIAMNPSVTEHAGTPRILVRTVNYTITPDGQYRIRQGDGGISDSAPIVTRNFIGVLDGDYAELTLPANWPDLPAYPLVRGFEDSRLFCWQGEFYTLSTVRELTSAGWCEQVLAPLDCTGDIYRYQDNWRRIAPGHLARRHEKNWMPWIRSGELQFVYRLGTLLDLDGCVVAQFEPQWNVDHISGGSQVVELDNRTFLALVHEARTLPGRSSRYYQHRFVIFDGHGQLSGISPPFFFFDRQIEFAAGLAWLPDKRQLMASYGVRDCEAWTATLDPDEVVRFVYRDALVL